MLEYLKIENYTKNKKILELLQTNDLAIILDAERKTFWFEKCRTKFWI